MFLHGGEPSIHPNVVDFAKTAKENGFLVKMFTNGIAKNRIKKLDGILDEIDEHLTEQSCIGLDKNAGRDVNTPFQLWIERDNTLAEVKELHIAQHRFLDLRELAVTIDKGCQPQRRVVDGADALLVGRTVYSGTLKVSLTDGEDGCRGIHDFVGQYPCEPLPGFHFVLRHELLDFLPHVVECLLQCLFAEEQATGGQAEHKIAVAYGIAHGLRPVLQHALVVMYAAGESHC